jgi:hypothetical protein
MQNLRRLPILALGLLAPLAVACSASAPSEPEGAGSANLDQARIYRPECIQIAPGCSVTADPVGWYDALSTTYYSSVPSVREWLSELESAGCTTPASFDLGSDLGGFWLTTCPSWVEFYPLPDVYGLTSFSQLVLTCDACVPLAPAGYVNVGFNFRGYTPGGCHEGSCAD